MIGLGRMGANMTRRLMHGGHSCVVYDRAPAQTFAVAREGATPAESLEDLVRKLPAPRIVWLMLPAGETTGCAIRDLGDLLGRGDIIVDSGNSHYRDDLARAEWLSGRGIEFVDCGTGGGIWGEQRGYCLTIGGCKETVEHIEPIFATLAPGEDSVPRTPGREGNSAEKGYLHCGPTGAGHFVKMAHNGIEYGLMQAFAEGFDLLHSAARLGYQLPVADIAEVWRRGSVISAWLLDPTAAALARVPSLPAWKAESGIPVRAVGRWRRRSRQECPARRWRQRSLHDSGRKWTTRLARRSCRRCGSASEGTSTRVNR